MLYAIFASCVSAQNVTNSTLDLSQQPEKLVLEGLKLQLQPVNDTTVSAGDKSKSPRIISIYSTALGQLQVKFDTPLRAPLNISTFPYDMVFELRAKSAIDDSVQIGTFGNASSANLSSFTNVTSNVTTLLNDSMQIKAENKTSAENCTANCSAQLLNFTWFVSKHEDRMIEFRLVFNNSNQVSKTGKPDKMQVHIKRPELIVANGTNNSYFDMDDRIQHHLCNGFKKAICSQLPQQVSNDFRDSYIELEEYLHIGSVASQGVFAFVLLVSLVTATPTYRMWALLRTIQLVTIFNFIDYQQTPLGQLLYNEASTVALLDFAHGRDLTSFLSSYALNFGDTGTYNQKFGQAHYETMTFLYNQGSVSYAICLLLVFLFFAFLFNRIALINKKNLCCRRVGVGSYNLMHNFPQIIGRIVLECYFLLGISASLNWVMYFRRDFNDLHKSIGDWLNFGFLIINSITLLGVLVHSLRTAFTHERQIETRDAKQSIMLQGISSTHTINAFYYPIFILRRVITVAVIIILPAYPDIQIGALFFLSAASLFYKCVQRPHETDRENNADLISETIVFFCSFVMGLQVFLFNIIGGDQMTPDIEEQMNDILGYIVTITSYCLIIFGLVLMSIIKIHELLAPCRESLYQRGRKALLNQIFINQAALIAHLPSEFPELESNVFEEEQRLFCKEWRAHVFWAVQNGITLETIRAMPEFVDYCKILAQFNHKRQRHLVLVQQVIRECQNKALTQEMPFDGEHFVYSKQGTKYNPQKVFVRNEESDSDMQPKDTFTLKLNPTVMGIDSEIFSTHENPKQAKKELMRSMTNDSPKINGGMSVSDLNVINILAPAETMHTLGVGSVETEENIFKSSSVSNNMTSKINGFEESGPDELELKDKLESTRALATVQVKEDFSPRSKKDSDGTRFKTKLYEGGESSTSDEDEEAANQGNQQQTEEEQVDSKDASPSHSEKEESQSITEEPTTEQFDSIVGLTMKDKIIKLLNGLEGDDFIRIYRQVGHSVDLNRLEALSYVLRDLLVKKRAKFLKDQEDEDDDDQLTPDEIMSKYNLEQQDILQLKHRGQTCFRLHELSLDKGLDELEFDDYLELKERLYRKLRHLPLDIIWTLYKHAFDELKIQAKLSIIVQGMDPGQFFHTLEKQTFFQKIYMQGIESHREKLEFEPSEVRDEIDFVDDIFDFDLKGSELEKFETEQEFIDVLNEDRNGKHLLNVLEVEDKVINAAMEKFRRQFTARRLSTLRNELSDWSFNLVMNLLIEFEFNSKNDPEEKNAIKDEVLDVSLENRVVLDQEKDSEADDLESQHDDRKKNADSRQIAPQNLVVLESDLMIKEPVIEGPVATEFRKAIRAMIQAEFELRYYNKTESPQEVSVNDLHEEVYKQLRNDERVAPRQRYSQPQLIVKQLLQYLHMQTIAKKTLEDIISKRKVTRAVDFPLISDQLLEVLENRLNISMLSRELILFRNYVDCPCKIQNKIANEYLENQFTLDIDLPYVIDKQKKQKKGDDDDEEEDEGAPKVHLPALLIKQFLVDQKYSHVQHQLAQDNVPYHLTKCVSCQQSLDGLPKQSGIMMAPQNLLIVTINIVEPVDAKTTNKEKQGFKNLVLPRLVVPLKLDLTILFNQDPGLNQLVDRHVKRDAFYLYEPVGMIIDQLPNSPAMTVEAKAERIEAQQNCYEAYALVVKKMKNYDDDEDDIDEELEELQSEKSDDGEDEEEDDDKVVNDRVRWFRFNRDGTAENLDDFSTEADGKNEFFDYLQSIPDVELPEKRVMPLVIAFKRITS